jgi:hypothetical protein
MARLKGITAAKEAGYEGESLQDALRQVDGQMDGHGGDDWDPYDPWASEDSDPGSPFEEEEDPINEHRAQNQEWLDNIEEELEEGEGTVEQIQAVEAEVQAVVEEGGPLAAEAAEVAAAAEAAAEAAAAAEIIGGTLSGIIAEQAAEFGEYVGPAMELAGIIGLIVTIVKAVQDEKRCPHPDRFTSTWDAAAQTMTGYQLPCSSPRHNADLAHDPGNPDAPQLLHALGSMFHKATPTEHGITPRAPTPTTFATSTVSGLTVINNASFIIVNSSSSIMLAPVVPITVGPTITMLIDTGNSIDSATNNGFNLTAKPTTTKKIVCPTPNYPPGFVGTKIAEAACPVQTPYECTDDWFHKNVNENLPDDVRNPNYCTNGDTDGHYEAEKMGCLPDFGSNAKHHKGHKKRKKCHHKFLRSPTSEGKDKGKHKKKPFAEEEEEEE